MTRTVVKQNGTNSLASNIISKKASKPELDWEEIDGQLLRIIPFISCVKDKSAEDMQKIAGELLDFIKGAKDFLSTYCAYMLFDEGYTLLDVQELYEEGFRDFYFLVASNAQLDIRRALSQYRDQYRPHNVANDKLIDKQKAGLELLACLIFPSGTE